MVIEDRSDGQERGGKANNPQRLLFQFGPPYSLYSPGLRTPDLLSPLTANQVTGPPVSLEIVTTAGRGGMVGSKSGHRVDGLSKFEASPSAGC